MTINARNRIIQNSAVMYLKMILSVGVTFYSTRIVLKALGVTDFGIYNLVAGAISLLSFFNGSISNTIQRYLAFELGRGNEQRIRNTFNISLTLNIFISIVIFVLLEIIGLFFFDGFLVIPHDKMQIAQKAYQIMTITTVVSIITTPYNAVLNSHEDLILIAIIEFTESCLKLVCAYVLLSLNSERLIYYCFFMLGIYVASLTFKVIYTKIKYPETHNIKLFDINRNILTSILPFWGWNMLEACSWLGKNQGIAVLMNTFYGTIVNAAYGIGSQINGPLTYFSSALLNAIRPQIYKSGGSGDFGRMIRLSIIASKFAYFSLFIFLVPFSYLAAHIFKLWLTVVPEYSERFSILLLTITLISYLSIGINIAIQSYGDVKRYQIIASAIILISIPIGYAIYAVSDNVYMFLYVMVIVECLSVIIKYCVASQILQVKVYQFFIGISLPCLNVTIISVVFTYIMYRITVQSFGYEFSTIILFAAADSLLIMTTIFLIGIKREERRIIVNIFNSIIKRIKI